jgi:two-component system, LytTR family, sensor histidine kinase AlgZ
MKTGPANDNSTAYYLPDFCTPRAVLTIVLMVELTALLLSISRFNADVGFWLELARTSVLLLWLGLTMTAALCWSRPYMLSLSAVQVTLAALGLVSALILVISALSWWAGRTEVAQVLGLAPLFPVRLTDFAIRNITIGLIVTTLALRYFYVTSEWERNVDMQARARVHALQARIRPHFLFNSMNTIASLTRTDPALAESAVQDLADLFRANLSEKRNTITLAEELDVTRIYQRIEELRLGARLRVDWKIDELPMQAIVPSLMLQPLIENAIYHGVEPQPLGGVVIVTGELSAGLITVVVRNRVTDRKQDRGGNNLALANIRERLSLMYGERALVKAGRFDDEYIVTLRFPHVESSETLPA